MNETNKYLNELILDTVANIVGGINNINDDQKEAIANLDDEKIYEILTSLTTRLKVIVKCEEAETSATSKPGYVRNPDGTYTKNFTVNYVNVLIDRADKKLADIRDRGDEDPDTYDLIQTMRDTYVHILDYPEKIVTDKFRTIVTLFESL